MSDNPVAIVTGGSRGVGAATARMLSENGWNVVITCSSSLKDADQVAKNCTNENAEVVALQADDIINIGKRTSLPIDVRIGNVNKFKAIPGLLGQYKAVKIQNMNK